MGQGYDHRGGEGGGGEAKDIGEVSQVRGGGVAGDSLNAVRA